MTKPPWHKFVVLGYINQAAMNCKTPEQESHFQLMIKSPDFTLPCVFSVNGLFLTQHFSTLPDQSSIFFTNFDTPMEASESNLG